MSAKEYLYGRKRRPSKGQDGTRAALYLRVSTADQKPDLQYDGLRAYAARAGLDIIQDYCDVGVSGRREGRPQLNALMAAARNHEIDCVLVWKFDRFARSTRHLLAALEEFNHLGVRFVSVQDQIDTDSPMGRAMFTIIGAMAELEVIAHQRACDRRHEEPRDTRQALGTAPDHPARHQRDRGACHVNRPQHSEDSGQNCRSGKPGTRRRDHKTRPYPPASSHVTTFYTFMPRSGLCRARPIIAGRAYGAAALRVSRPRHNP